MSKFFGLDTEQILADNHVQLRFSGEELMDGDGNIFPDPTPCWEMWWSRGNCAFLSNLTEEEARRVAAVCVHLRLNGISMPLAEHCAIAVVKTWKVETL